MAAKKDQLVIWPVYIDVHMSRGMGRMVSKHEALQQPKIDEIAYAAIELGLDPTVERDKQFPGHWYERPGRVLVAKKGKKSAILRNVAKVMRRRRK
jgi:signal recognition particle subunit SRP19